MEFMKLSEPQMLYFLGIVPIVFLLFFIAHRKQKKNLQSIGYVDTLNSFSNRTLAGSLPREGLFACLALIFFILALTKPQAGTRLEPERAKIDALELIGSLQGDRAGIIFFAGDAFVQCPLTSDYDALTAVVNSLSFETAVSSGTSLAEPLQLAMQSLEPEEDKYAVLLLLTDGENTGPDPDKAIRDIGKREIKVFTIGIGSTAGAPIPVYEENGKRTGYKKDQYGKVVISQLDEYLLEQIAEKTGGHYLKTSDNFDEVKRFVSTLETLKKREFETKRYTVYEERFQIPLGLGILFMLIYLFIKMRTKVSQK
jgi:Ca-activated chloride channel family protein